MYKIFIVEDDEKIRTELSVLLTKYGYTCDMAHSFENVAEEVLASASHLVLLDINLPHFDGFHVCKEIREQSDIPIIVVTSRDSDIDELMSMHTGADDFITKPYNTQILLARIESLIRRSYQSDAGQTLSHRGLTLHLGKSTATYQEKTVELTKNEVGILSLLLENKGEIVSRERIMDYLWQSSEFIDDNTLTVNVNRLRDKLSEIGKRDFLTTRRGQGYMV